MSNSNTEIEKIPVSDIRPNPYQPRKSFKNSSLKELGQSIETYGVLQPINVRKLGAGSYELVAGERRLRAAKKVGLEKVPAIIVEMREEESAIVALMENLQREDLNFIEEANGYNNLIIDHGLTQSEIAGKIGKSQSTIANKLRILKLPIDLQREILENDLSERHARAILKLPSYELKKETLDSVIEQGYNVKQTEKLVDTVLDSIIEEDKKSDSVEGRDSKQNIKSLINTRIYLNTIKSAYKTIKETGVDADYEERDSEDFVEVIVRIPKNIKS